MNANTKTTQPFKACACGRTYTDRAAWERLAGGHIFVSPDGALVEDRQCACESTITATLVAAMNVDELRRAVRVLDMMSESFNMAYTAPDLLRLVKVCWSGDWDITPDEWTPTQIIRALEEGRAPNFEETRDGIHALGVDDCRCFGCKRRREDAADEALEAQAEVRAIEVAGCYEDAFGTGDES